MYGRNSYDRNTNQYPINNTSNTNNTNNTREVPLLGSNRLDYSKESIGRLDGVVNKWGKEEIPSSITCRLETLHLSSAQLRLEDYFLMRKDKLRVHQMDRVREAIRNQSFNEQLLKTDPKVLPFFSQERALDIDAVKQILRGGSFGTSNPSNNSNGIFSSNTPSTNQIFSRTGQDNNSNNSTSNNVFMRTSNSNSGNIFSGSNNSSGNANGNNIFNGGSGNVGNSYYNNNSSNNNNTSNNSSSNNIFGAGNSNNNNSSSNNPFNRNSNQSSNNIFGNSSSNNNSNTSNNNLNNSTANNVFNRPQNSSNPFTSNQTTSNNIFNSNSNSNSNSLFNQNSNSNNGNNYSSNGNNPFNNQTQGGSNQDMIAMMTTLNSYLSQTQQYMLLLHQHAKHNQNIDQNQQETSLYREEIYSHKVYEVPEWEKTQPKEVIIVMPQRPPSLKWNTGKQIQLSQRPEIIQEQSQLIGRPVHSQYIRQESGAMRSSSKFTQMQSVRPTYQGSMIHSRREVELRIEGPCLVSISLQVQWTDIDFKKYKRLKEDIKLEEIIAKDIRINSLDLESEAGRTMFLSRIAEDQSLGIRMDAVIKIDRKMTSINVRGNTAEVVGKIEQRLVNIDPEYQVYYTRIKSGHIEDFTISRHNIGNLAWDAPIPYKNLDFQRIYSFAVEENEVDCKLPALQSSCRANFKRAPESIMNFIKEKGLQQAKMSLKQRVEGQGNGIKLGQLWENGEWCVIFPTGFCQFE